MSNETYNTYWQEALDSLHDEITFEDPTLGEDPDKPSNAPPPIAGVNISGSFQHFARLYIKYLQIFRKLEQCYDSMVHPQKRLDVKVVLELVMQRVIQLKHLLVKWNPPRAELQPKPPAPEIFFPWEYVNLDDILADLKMPPEALEVPVPAFFREDNASALKLRDKMISGYMQLKHGSDSIPLEEDLELDPPLEALGLEQVLEIIQRNERGRQGKARGILKRDDLFNRLRVATAATKVDPPEEVAACDFQRVYRGYRARVMVLAEREAELEFLGMKPAPGAAASDAKLVEELATAQRKRKTEQAENKESYAKALVDLKEEVQRDEGPRMRDQLRQERHLWVTDKIAETKDIPEDLTEFYKDRYPALPEPEPVEEAGGGKKGKKDEKKKDDKKGGKKGKKKKDAADDGPPEAPPPLQGKTETTTVAFERIVNYRGVWEGKDESYNFSQKHDVELAKQQIRVDVEKELRDSVDEMLKQNLAKIKAQLNGAGKGGKKGKKGKGGKKGKKGKGGKKGKKGKGKGKALPGEKISDIKNLELDEMLALLVDSKVINSYRPRRICDFVGGCSYQSSKKDTNEPETAKKAPMPIPSMAQIRSAVTEYAVLPLGSTTVKAKLESCNVKTMMLYGPAGAGKTMMVEAVAHELGALLVNISPSKLIGQFPGKTGPAKLLHLIYKVASENPEVFGPGGNPQAPVVIYMDECEKFFEAVKKSKVDKSGPSRFKKDLLTYKNSGFKPLDRVIFIGCTRNPEKADKKELKQFFDKFLYLPYPDYPSRLLLWRSFINMTLSLQDAPLLEPFFDLSTLARISDGFSAGALERVIKKTLTKKRISRLSSRPLNGSEFLNSLALEASLNQQNYIIDSNNFNDFTELVTGLTERRKKIDDLSNPAAGGDDKKKKKKK
jgi:MoxR-like ATPase